MKTAKIGVSAFVLILNDYFFISNGQNRGDIREYFLEWRLQSWK